jgi:hypothetical protein
MVRDCNRPVNKSFHLTYGHAMLIFVLGQDKVAAGTVTTSSSPTAEKRPAGCEHGSGPSKRPRQTITVGSSAGDRDDAALPSCVSQTLA